MTTEKRMAQSLNDRLSEIFRIVFELPDDSDPTQAQQAETRAWDSLGHVTLVTALESEFEIEISVVDSMEISSYSAALMLVEDLIDEQRS